MHHIRPHIDRWFISFIGLFILSQISLGLKDTSTSKDQLAHNNGISSFINPKSYFISKAAPLFKNFGLNNRLPVEKMINEILRELGVRARLVENTIRLCNGSFEFKVYIPIYKKDFIFRYTPLIGDLTKLIQKEGFILEVKLLSGWMPVTLDRLFR